MTHVTRRPWTSSDDLMLRAYAGRFPAAEVARRLKRSRQAVYHRAGKHGIRLQSRGEKHPSALYSDETVRGVLRRYFDGETLHALARSTGIPVGTISTWTSGNSRRELRVQVVAE